MHKEHQALSCCMLKQIPLKMPSIPLWYAKAFINIISWILLCLNPISYTLVISMYASVCFLSSLCSNKFLYDRPPLLKIQARKTLNLPLTAGKENFGLQKPEPSWKLLCCWFPARKRMGWCFSLKWQRNARLKLNWLNSSLQVYSKTNLRINKYM